MKIPKARQVSSGRWFVRLRIDGRTINITEDTEAAAEARAAMIKSGLQEDRRDPGRLTTVDGCLTRYIEMNRGVLSPSTLRGYEQIRLHRFPELMPRRVSLVRRQDVQRAVSREAGRCSAKTLKNAYALLVKAVRELTGEDWSGCHLPQVVKPEKRYLEEEEVFRLIAAAKGDLAEIPIVMAAWLGMRRSEIFGLRWRDVDYARKTITIRQTALEGDGGVVIRNGAKNLSSQRTLSCPEYIFELLAGIPLPPKHERICGFLHPNTARKHVHELCRKAGIPDTSLHGLRHTNAALMLREGIPEKYAMERGGWATDATMKDVYAYTFASTKKESDRRMDLLFEEGIALAGTKNGN